MCFCRPLDEFTGSSFATMDVAKHFREEGRLVVGSKGLLTQPVTLPGQDRQTRCLRVIKGLK
jgi:hypothetical protein